MRRPSGRLRPGYTLVEILVVMGLMLLLAALAAAVGYSGLIGSQRTVGAADRASGWLLIAKQQALRDKQPRGVRFIGTPGPAGTGAVYFREAQYIEAPEAYVPNPDQESAPQKGRIVFVYQWTSNNSMANPNFDSENGAPIDTTPVLHKEVYFVSNDSSDIVDFNQRVAAGDSLVLPEFNASYRLTATPTAATEPLSLGGTLIPTTNAVKLTLQTNPDLTAAGTQFVTPVPATGRLTTLQTYKFAFQGQARPLVGEPVLQLTNGLAIDLQTTGQTTTIGVNPTAPDPLDNNKVTFDILFSPSGQVLNNPQALICLWVRNPETLTTGATPRPGGTAPNDDATAYSAAGEQVLIAVSTRSGLISTQPVSPPPDVDPYRFAKDGQNNGV